MAASQSGFAYTPLAFGEVSVRSRIKHVLHHTKRNVWVAVAAVAVLLIVTAGLLFRPAAKTDSLIPAMHSPDPTTDTADQENVFPSPSATTIDSVFQTSWDKRTGDTGMTEAESDRWQGRLREDIPHLDDYTVMGCRTGDYDMNGIKDMITQVRIESDAAADGTYPGAYLCVYMNDDPVYMESYAGSLYVGFMQEPLYGDIDNDGYPEIVITLFTGGNGGAGSSYKDVLKYTGHSLEKNEPAGRRRRRIYR